MKKTSHKTLCVLIAIIATASMRAGDPITPSLKIEIDFFLGETLKRLGKGKDQEIIAKAIPQEYVAIQRGECYVKNLNDNNSVMAKPDFYDLVNGWDKTAMDFPPHSTLEHYQEALRDIMSYFYFVGCTQTRLDRQGFTEGTLFIADHNKNFEKFLEKLRTKANAEAKDKNPIFYVRPSSHDFGETYGIDLWKTSPWLFRFCHLLVGFDNNGGIWLKPQKDGVKEWGDRFYHVLDYLKSQTNKRWSWLTGTDGDSISCYSKERVPRREALEFYKIFPECNEKMKLGQMYQYAVQRFLHPTSNDNVVQIKTFIDTLLRNYDHIIDGERSGREPRLTADELLLSNYFFKTNDAELAKFYKEFIALKHAVAQYKHGNYDYFGGTLRSSRSSQPQQHVSQHSAYEILKKFIDNFVVSCSKTLKKISSDDIKKQFEDLVTVIEFYKKHNMLESKISYQPIFESRFQKEVLWCKAVKERSYAITQEKLSCQVMARLEEFKATVTQLIGDFCAKHTITYKPVALPLKGKKSTGIAYEPLKEFMETYILDLNQTDGLRKTREFSCFAGTKYSDSDFMQSNSAIIMAIYGVAQNTHQEKQQKELLDVCKKIKEFWDEIMAIKIPFIAEQHDRIVTTSDVGKKIIAACVQQADKQFDELLKFYKDIHDECAVQAQEEQDVEWSTDYTTMMQQKEDFYKKNIRPMVESFFMLFDSKTDLIDKISHDLGAVVSFDSMNRDNKGSLESEWLAKARKFKETMDNNAGVMSRAMASVGSVVGGLKFW